ncbi:hypothetical protein Hanom_Chr04g00327501 [Helianthus anomalus]
MSAYRTTTIEDNGHEMQMEIPNASQNQCRQAQKNSCDDYLRSLRIGDIKNL